MIAPLPRVIDQIDTNVSGVSGLIFVGEQIIVYRRDYNTTNHPGFVDLPGGGREEGETPFDAFAREVFEEFGLKVDRSQVEYARAYYSPSHGGKYAFFMVAKLPAEATESIVFGDEGLEYWLMDARRYAVLSDAPRFHKRSVRDYLHWLNVPHASMAQTGTTGFYNYDAECVGAGGMVFIGNQIVVERRDGSTRNHPFLLDLPGGTNEPGETPFETFRREAYEEVGLVINERDIHFVRRYPSTNHPGYFNYFVVVRLPARTMIHFGNEGLGYELMLVDNFLRAPDAWPIHQEHVTDYLLWRKSFGLPLPK